MSFTVWMESFRLAFREMRRHGTRSILTMFGVIVGVGAIIAVVGISEGAKRTIQGQIESLGTNMVICLPGSTSESGVRAGAGSAATLTLEDAQAIERECSSVVRAAPVARSVFQAVSELANWSTPVIGTNSSFLEVRTWSVTSGRPLLDTDEISAAKICLIGQTTREQLYGDEDPVGQRIRLKGTPMEIVGVLEKKGQSPLGEDQDDVLIVPITTFFRHLSGDQRLQAIVAAAADETELKSAINQMTALLRQRHHLGNNEVDDFSIKSIDEFAKTAENTSNVMTLLLMSIAAISLLVGGIGIMNIMLVTVMERTREIGIRLAVGATRKMIMQQFMIESATLAGVGGIIGIALGVVSSDLLAKVTGWPAIISPPLLMGPLLFAVAIGMIFGLLPARRASRLSPVESLRHD